MPPILCLVETKALTLSCILLKNDQTYFKNLAMFTSDDSKSMFGHFLTLCMEELIKNPNPTGNCMFKVNNRNTRTRCETCSKLTIKTPERRHWSRFGVFIVNLEHISHLVLVFLMLTLSRQMPAGNV